MSVEFKGFCGDRGVFPSVRVLATVRLLERHLGVYIRKEKWSRDDT